MKDEYPIIFSAPMVNAILEGKKTVTRRIVKPHPPMDQIMFWMQDKPGLWGAYDVNGLLCTDIEGSRKGSSLIRCPYGSKNGRLWVKETWRLWEYEEKILEGSLKTCSKHLLERKPEYRADSLDDGPWRAAIHMCRAHSRITLEIENIRIEKLGDMANADYFKEGFQSRDAFLNLWRELNGALENRWVWVIEFKVI